MQAEIHPPVCPAAHTRIVAALPMGSSVAGAGSALPRPHVAQDCFRATLNVLAQPIRACAHVFDDLEPIWFVDVFDPDAGLFCCRCDTLCHVAPEDRPSCLLCGRCARPLSVVDAEPFHPMAFSLTIRRLNALRKVDHTINFFGLQCQTCVAIHA